MAFEIEYLQFLINLRVALLTAIERQRRQYTPIDYTQTWDDTWFSSDMYEVEVYSHRYLQPMSMTMNY